MYKLKHVPTGLYYQPHKHRGSNISKRGKVYQTKTHGLSRAYRNKSKTFTVIVEKDSVVHKETKDVLAYVPCEWSYNQMTVKTNIDDWIIEVV
jgi:lysozyme family protein